MPTRNQRQGFLWCRRPHYGSCAGLAGTSARDDLDRPATGASPASGTDGLSIGPAEGGAPAHLTGLPHGVTLIEALGRLDQVPPRCAWFQFLPLRLDDGTGSPGRPAQLPVAGHQYIAGTMTVAGLR